MTNYLLTILLCCLAVVNTAKAANDYVPQSYTWTTQSKNSSESMPCGGHDVGMNVWVENGDVLIYLSRSGFFDENNTLLKAGRLRLHVTSASGDSPVLNSSDFQQTLSLDEGCIYIKGGNMTLRLWADVKQPVVHLTLNSKAKVNATLSYESWRHHDRVVPKGASQQFTWKWINKGDHYTYADSINVSQHAITFLHHNRKETVYDYTVNYEGLDAVKDQIPDPIGGKTFGGTLYCPAFTYTGTTDGKYASTDFRAWNFRAEGVKSTAVVVDLAAGEKATATAPATVPSASASGSKVTATNAPAIVPSASASGSKVTATNAPAIVPSASASGTPVQFPMALPSGSTSTSLKQSKAWWHAYWQRSYIYSDNAEVQKLLRNYELFRYMLGCNAYGAWPTKFNGGLFTFDPEYVDSTMDFTPDFRCWGGGTMTAQNQRLVYWPMLKSGDLDMMEAQFDTYLRMLPAAIARTKHYWGHEGACFEEQIENFGLPNPAEYGKHKPGDDPGLMNNKWLEHLYDTVLEFCQMILLADEQTRALRPGASASGSSASVQSPMALPSGSSASVQSPMALPSGSKGSVQFPMALPSGSKSSAPLLPQYSKYLPLIVESLKFFDEHYQMLARQYGMEPLSQQDPGSWPPEGLDPKGRKLVIYPGAGAETYKMAYNPSSTVAALQYVLATIDKKHGGLQAWGLDSSLIYRIPDIPLRTLQGDTCIAPAVAWMRIQNVETPQLYPVFPWRICGIAQEGQQQYQSENITPISLQTGRNTVLKDPWAIQMHSPQGWKQDNIWAALLGLEKEAVELLKGKFANGPYRFPAFWERGFDWAPDHNRGGSAMIGLQEMLLQERPDGTYMLFPTWPKEWNCTFRLHTATGKVVTATLKNGKITE